jgi:BolA family transcriptional regulator, general stress-responsive regulator
MDSIVRPTLAELKARFSDHFPGDSIELTDDSHLHAGHAGSQGGAGHYSVVLSSQRFVGLNTLARHRLVYDAVRDWMPHRVHALVIKAVCLS